MLKNSFSINKKLNFYNKNFYLLIKLFKKNEINFFENLIKKKANKHIKKNNWNYSRQ